MTQEEKELLFKDLCSRLPYGVKVNTIYSNEHASFYRRRACKNGVNVLTLNIMWLYHVQFEIDIKPYLFPLESMTEEQKKEFLNIQYEDRKNLFDALIRYRYEKEDKIPIIPLQKHIDWLNENHFDYRGLIPMGLAKDATGLNIY